MKMRALLIFCAWLSFAASAWAQFDNPGAIGSTIPGPFSAGSLTLTGNVTFVNAASPSAGTAAIFWSANVLGQCNNGVPCAVVQIQSGDINATCTQSCELGRFVGTDGTSLTGSINILDATLQMFNTSSNLTTQNYQAFNAWAHASANDNGTSGTASGNLFGAGIKGGLDTGATFWNGVHAAEFDIYLATGSSAHYVDGVSVILGGNNAVAGGRENNGFYVGAGSGATATMTCAFCIGSYESFNPLASGASIMTWLPNSGSGSGPSITSGINLTQFTFSANPFAAPNSSITEVAYAGANPGTGMWFPNNNQTSIAANGLEGLRVLGAGTISLFNQATAGTIVYAVCAAAGANGTSGGSIILDISATICGLSSRRWKEREFDLSSDKALDIAMHLRPETFYFKPGYNEGRTHEQIGFIAEDVALADERLIERDPMGLPRGVSYAQGIPTIAIGAIQNHEARIEALEAKVH